MSQTGLFIFGFFNSINYFIFIVDAVCFGMDFLGCCCCCFCYFLVGFFFLSCFVCCCLMWFDGVMFVLG